MKLKDFNNFLQTLSKIISLTKCVRPERTNTVETIEDIKLIPEIATTESGFILKVKMDEEQMNYILDLKLLVNDLQKEVESLSEKLISLENKPETVEAAYVRPTRASKFDDINPDQHSVTTYKIKEVVKFLDENIHGGEGSFTPLGKLLKKAGDELEIGEYRAANTSHYVKILKKFYYDFFKCKKTYNGRTLVWSIAKFDDNMLF